MQFEKHIDGLYSVHMGSDLDLIALRTTADEMYSIITSVFKNDKNDYKGRSSITTRLYSKYNFLLYPFPGIHKLYFAISSAFHNCFKEHYGFYSNGSEEFMIQCWMNFYKKGEFIDWHQHVGIDNGSWHGFLCLDTEPNSYTSYRWPNDPNRQGILIDVPSKNGTIVMGRSNCDLHRSSEWQEDRPRITIAFDIQPREAVIAAADRYPTPKYLNAMQDSHFFVNHWIPI